MGAAGSPRLPSARFVYCEDGRAEHRRNRRAGGVSGQVLFAGIGERGQRRQGESHAVVVGVGATGAAAAGLLARAGVGRLTLIDRDYVGSHPICSGRRCLTRRTRGPSCLRQRPRGGIWTHNSSVRVEARIAEWYPTTPKSCYTERTWCWMALTTSRPDILINDLCVREGLPWIYAAAVGAYAATMKFCRWVAMWAQPPPAWRVSFRQPRAGNVETCETAGSGDRGESGRQPPGDGSHEVADRTAGAAAAESGTSFDLWTGERSEIATRSPRKDCEVCGGRV